MSLWDIKFSYTPVSMQSGTNKSYQLLSHKILHLLKNSRVNAQAMISHILEFMLHCIYYIWECIIIMENTNIINNDNIIIWTNVTNGTTDWIMYKCYLAYYVQTLIVQEVIADLLQHVETRYRPIYHWHMQEVCEWMNEWSFFFFFFFLINVMREKVTIN